MKPPQPKGVAELSYAGSVKWVESTGADRYRRGLYIHFQRTVPYPQLMNFDAPNSNLSCTRRERTEHPAAGAQPAERPGVLRSRAGSGLPRHARIAAAASATASTTPIAITLGREPSAREAERLGKYFDEASCKRSQPTPKTVAALFPNRLEGVPQAEAAAWVEVSRVLLNLDEFITRE